MDLRSLASESPSVSSEAGWLELLIVSRVKGSEWLTLCSYTDGEEEVFSVTLPTARCLSQGCIHTMKPLGTGHMFGLGSRVSGSKVLGR